MVSNERKKELIGVLSSVIPHEFDCSHSFYSQGATESDEEEDYISLIIDEIAEKSRINVLNNLKEIGDNLD